MNAEEVRKIVWHNVQDNVLCNVRYNAWANVEENLRYNVMNNVHDNVRYNVMASITLQIHMYKLTRVSNFARISNGC